MKPAHIIAAALAATLCAAPIAAHADDHIAGDEDGQQTGIDCTYELLWDNYQTGKLYSPALNYEVVNFCGHEPTIVWPDESMDGPKPLEYWLGLLLPVPEVAPPLPEATFVEEPVVPVEVAAPVLPVKVWLEFARDVKRKYGQP